MSERCQRCGEMGNDRRTLFMACFYEMDELDVPFHHITFFQTDHEDTEKMTQREFYFLRVCKDCRSGWMNAIESWFGEMRQERESTGTGVYIRKHGTTVEATAEEVEEMRRRKMDDDAGPTTKQIDRSIRDALAKRRKSKGD